MEYNCFLWFKILLVIGYNTIIIQDMFEMFTVLEFDCNRFKRKIILSFYLLKCPQGMIRF